MNARMIMHFVIFLLLAGCAKYTGPIAGERGITFMVNAPEARQVTIVGSFNGWDKEHDRLSGPDKSGWWTITLPLGIGRHEYLLLLNSAQWLLDPYAGITADDGFGGKNGILYVGRAVGTGIAQGPSDHELEKRVTDAKFVPLLTLASEAQEKGLPTRLVLNKVLEGLAKVAADDLVKTRAELTLKHLETAAVIVNSAVSAGVLEQAPRERVRANEAAAVLLDIGISRDDIAGLGRDAAEKKIPLPWFSRTMEAMANLIGGGMSSDLAVRTARILILDRYSEKFIGTVEGELFYWRENKYNWTDAFYRFHSGCRPGMGCFSEDGYMQ
jgi:hypothetical protein